MKATFDLKIFNDVTLAGSKCTLYGRPGQDIVSLCLVGEHSGVTIELSAAELIDSASRITATRFSGETRTCKDCAEEALALFAAMSTEEKERVAKELNKRRNEAS